MKLIIKPSNQMRWNRDNGLQNRTRTTLAIGKICRCRACFCCRSLKLSKRIQRRFNSTLNLF